jgi:hypothetical protein
LALIGCLAFAVQYSQNANISVAIVCMVNHTAIDRTQEINYFTNHSLENNDECKISTLTEQSNVYIYTLLF